MGREIDLIKFNRTQFNSVRQADNTVCISAANVLQFKEEVASFRKHYDVQTLFEEYRKVYQCDYGELTHWQLLQIRRQARLTSGYDPCQMKNLAKELDRILRETDFTTEVIAWTWL